MSKVQRFARNPHGRDWVVGDIHGCFSRLRQHLDEHGFDPAVDRLFSVGDLVDRGPESELALEWLAYPWFHAVLGNHEQMAIDWVDCPEMDAGTYAYNGGMWNIGNPSDERIRFSDAFRGLPVAIELETAAGLVGIVHADCPRRDWSGMVAALDAGDERVENACLWSRSRIKSGYAEPVEGVQMVIVGHTPLKSVCWLGNVFHIDTGAVFGGELTVLDIATLAVPTEVTP